MGNIQDLEWMAALRHTYFRVVCCCLSIFLAPAFLVRVLHPCVALALWKLLRGCGWAMAAACSRGGRISLTVCFVGNCSLVLWPNCGKHLTNSLVLHCFATARMKVKSILQALCSCTCLWKLQREKHLRITQCVVHIRASQPHSMWNVYSQHSSWNRSLLCLGLALELDFSVIVWAIIRGHGQETESALSNVLKRNLSLLCMAPHDYSLARNDFHNGQHWMERFGLSVYRSRRRANQSWKNKRFNSRS